MCIYIYAYIYRGSNICVYIYICIHICVYIYICRGCTGIIGLYGDNGKENGSYYLRAYGIVLSRFKGDDR